MRLAATVADPDAMMALATAFFRASAAGDGDALRALCAPDWAGQQNGGHAFDVDALVRLSTAAKRALPDFRYENVRRAATSEGFVEEHDVRATLADGSALSLPVCVVADVRNGKILHMREYFDSRQAEPLLAALR
jgi:ketosteroid isomerase-like protein